MATKQLIIQSQDLQNHQNEWLTFILQNGSVFFGQLMSIKSNRVNFKNSRQNRVSVSLTDITEIWKDENS
jgi:small nuclear ribonucleoprotein (snRNP)-like protein